jgi:tetratricopeptide (TPR) repeat protein
MSDIFAFGVTFYELLTGLHPFSSTDPAVIMYRILNVEPDALRSLLPDCPESLERIVNRALAKSREARYSSLADVAADTKPILMDLRRQQAGELFSQADELLRGDRLDAAQSAVRKALELDPWHAEARQLRSHIEQALRRRGLVDRAGALLDRAERKLSQREFNEAAECLATVKQMSLDDARINARLERANSQIEQARNVIRLLDAAHEYLHREDLTEAFRAVSEVLVSDPGNGVGQQLLQEIRTRMTSREAQRRTQEEIARAESLLSIGEIDQALALLTDIESREPSHKKVSRLRARAAAQKAEEERARRLAEAVAAVKALLRDRQFDEAVGRIDECLGEFAGNPELMALRRHAAEQVAAQKRAEEIRNLKAAAAAWIESGEYDRAIHALEAGVALLGDDGDLTRLLQAAAAKKAAQERDQALSRIIDDIKRLRRQGKLDDTFRGVERAIQTWGNDPSLQQLRQEVSDELREKERRPTDEGLTGLPNEPPLVSERAPVLVPVEISDSLSRGRGVLLSLRASIPNGVARWITVPTVTVVAGIVLIFGFWLFQPSHDADSLQVQALVQKAIQDRNWIDAERRLNEYSRGQHQDDPGVVELQRQIAQGKRSELASLQEIIPNAIATRQWPEAEASIDRFEKLAPADPRAAGWRKQVEAGLALSQSLSDLRSSILNAIRGKHWAKASVQIDSLQAKMPNDPQAAEWRRLVALNLKPEEQRLQEEQDQMDLARAEQLLQQGAYPAAIELFQGVLKESPGSVRARKGLKQAMDAKATEDKIFGRGH